MSIEQAIAFMEKMLAIARSSNSFKGLCFLEKQIPAVWIN